MPTSEVYSIPIVVETIKKLKPRSILDIGCGFGKYGFLLREQLDICMDQKNNTEDYIIHRKNWKTRIDAVEVFENYICELQRYIYDNIYIGNASDLIEKLTKYDVIIMADVIEHFDKRQGKELLNKIYRNANKLIIITTPLGEFEQAALCGNDFEKHLSIWRINDFKEYSNKKIVNVYNHGLCIFIYKESNQIKLPNLKAKFPMNEMIKTYIIMLLGEKNGENLVNFITRKKRSFFQKKRD